MAVSWNDIEDAVTNSAIETLDKSTLEEYLKVEPPEFNNPGLISKAQYVQQRLLRRLAQIELNEQAQLDKSRYKKNLIIAVLTLLVATIAAWPVIRDWFRPLPSILQKQELQSLQSGSTPSIHPENQAADTKRQEPTRKSK